MTRRVQREMVPVMGHPHGSSAAKANGFCVWEYTGKEWTMKKDCSNPDAVSAGVPRIAGRFRGQLRVVPSVKLA